MEKITKVDVVPPTYVQQAAEFAAGLLAGYKAEENGTMDRVKTVRDALSYVVDHGSDFALAWLSEQLGTSIDELADKFAALDGVVPVKYILHAGVAYHISLDAEECAEALDIYGTPQTRQQVEGGAVAVVPTGGMFVYLIQQAENGKLVGSIAYRHFDTTLHGKKLSASSMDNIECLEVLFRTGYTGGLIASLLNTGYAITLADPATPNGMIHVQVVRGGDDAKHPYFIGTKVLCE